MLSFSFSFIDRPSLLVGQLLVLVSALLSCSQLKSLYVYLWTFWANKNWLIDWLKLCGISGVNQSHSVWGNSDAGNRCLYYSSLSLYVSSPILSFHSLKTTQGLRPLTCCNVQCSSYGGTGATENARHEFAAPVCTGGNCGTWKCGTNLQGWKMREKLV